MGHILIMCHDSSYMVNLDDTSHLAAFIIHCKSTGYEFIGCGVDRLDSVDNYCGEILGALML